jgi:hypothetical protein
MMVSFLGSTRQTLQALFLIRYLVIRPLWATLRTTVLPSALNTLLCVLSALGNNDIPLE